MAAAQRARRLWTQRARAAHLELGAGGHRVLRVAILGRVRVAAPLAVRLASANLHKPLRRAQAVRLPLHPISLRFQVLRVRALMITCERWSASQRGRQAQCAWQPHEISDRTSRPSTWSTSPSARALRSRRSVLMAPRWRKAAAGCLAPTDCAGSERLVKVLHLACMVEFMVGMQNVWQILYAGVFAALAASAGCLVESAWGSGDVGVRA